MYSVHVHIIRIQIEISVPDLFGEYNQPRSHPSEKI